MTTAAGTDASFGALKQIDAWWYQFYFATERGRAGYGRFRNDFARLIWQIASPKWELDDATFDRTAWSFDKASDAFAEAVIEVDGY